MSTKTGTRAIVMQAIDKFATSTPTGFDKPAWRMSVSDWLRQEEPTVWAELAADSIDVRLNGLIDEYIRSSRTPAVEGVRQLEEIKRRVSEEQRIVQVKRDDGVFEAKTLKQCTAAECRRLADFYEERESSDGRRKRFYADLATQLELGNFATVADFLAS